MPSRPRRATPKKLPTIATEAGPPSIPLQPKPPPSARTSAFKRQHGPAGLLSTKPPPTTLQLQLPALVTALPALPALSRPASRSDSSANYFFRPDPLSLLLGEEQEAQPSAVPSEASGSSSSFLRPTGGGPPAFRSASFRIPSTFVLPPLEDYDDELLDCGSGNLLDELTDDILLMILEYCPAYAHAHRTRERRRP